MRLFESGLVFRDEGNGPTVQRAMLAGLALGARLPTSWDSDDKDVDFYDVKSDIEALLSSDAERVRYRPATHAALHPGRSADVLLDEHRLGVFGELHPALLQSLKLRAAPVVFELELAMLTATGVPEFQPFSRYPGVRRDLSVLVAEDVSVQAVTDCVGQAAGDVLQNLELFDLYRGEGIDSGRKSLTLALTFQDASRTLDDSEVDASMEQIQASLAKHLGGTLRG